MSDETGLICWPEWLPVPQQSGHKQTTANKHKAIDVENGLGKPYYNPDTSNKAAITLLLDEGQKLYWEIWFDQVLLNGLKWFCCPMIGLTGAVEERSARIVPQSQVELSPVGGGLDYNLKLQLEMGKVAKPPVSILYYYPLFGSREYFECNADRVYTLINYDMVTATTLPEVV